MAVSNVNSGNWQISSGTPTEVIAEIMDHCTSPQDIAGISYDGTGSKLYVLFRVTRGTE